MDLKGNLDTMPIPDILQWISDSSKTGTLKVSYKSEVKEIYFQDGVIVSASSNLDKDRFGVLVVKEGYVSQQKLLDLLEEGKSQGKLLGKLCVEKRIITEDDVQRMLQNQAERIIESIFHRREGEFAFIEGDLPQKELVPISIVMHQLFFDSAAKRNDWRRIHNVLGRLTTILKPASEPPAPLATLTEFEQYLITLSSGKNTILDLCAKIDRSDFEICVAFTRLVENKWLIKSEQPADADKVLQDKIWQASILLEQKRFLQAVKLLESLQSKLKDHAEIESLLYKSKQLLKTDIEKFFTSEETKPKAISSFDPQKLQDLKFNPQEWFVYSRINGLTSIRDLYRISGLGKEATQRVIYLLAKVGAIEFGETRHSAKPSPRKTASLHMDIHRVKREPEKPAKPAKSTKTPEPLPTAVKVPEDKIKQSQPQDIPDKKELDRVYQHYLRQNNYEILNVSRNASPGKIRDAFVNLSKKYHPDMHYVQLPKPVQDRLSELFGLVISAYRVLSNPVTRQRYDEEIWANERFGKKELDDLSALIQKTTPKPTPIPAKPKPAPEIKKETEKKPEESPKSEQPEKEQRTDTKTKMKRPDLKTKKTKIPSWQEKIKEGLTLLKEKKYTQASKTLEEALKYNARDPKLYYQLSMSYFKQGVPGADKAIEHIKRALILDPENSTYYCQLSRSLLVKGLKVEAEKYAKTAIAWDSTSKEARDLLKEIREQAKTGIFKLKFLKKK
ncbi:DUF4388 domain-containing protein [bacterium]|nr:DUF4388 domain-containing protein [candidate division CSSED10-310 bacterium]